jgi:predicted GNAT family N-acyltransferase
VKALFLGITYGSSEYQQCLALRDQVLRKPLGLEFTSAELAKDISDIHLGLQFEKQVIACLVLTRISNQIVKMRQVAVAAKFQNKSLGKFLILETENYLKALGYKKIELHARKNVLDFYLKLSYQEEGDIFEEVGIDHKRMVKTL